MLRFEKDGDGNTATYWPGQHRVFLEELMKEAGVENYSMDNYESFKSYYRREIVSIRTWNERRNKYDQVWTKSSSSNTAEEFCKALEVPGMHRWDKALFGAEIKVAALQFDAAQMKNLSRAYEFFKRQQVEPIPENVS